MEKKTSKKLTLTRETVRVLTDDQLTQAAGGLPPITTAVTCGCTRSLCPQTYQCSNWQRCDLPY